ncbi:MAG: hypothetical protein V1916_00700 [Patescibacteria group bacterium]
MKAQSLTLFTILITITLITLLLLGATWYYQAHQPAPQPARSTAGATDRACTQNADCAALCDTGSGCLVPSCSVRPDSATGTCICLDTCGQ